jgi:uncharacterized protein (TIGR00369 family)
VSTHSPRDANFAQRVRDSFARQTIMALIGARLAEVEAGKVTIELPFRDDLCQQHGFFHAGVTSTIADSAGGYAAFSLYPAGSSVLTVEFKINLLAPAAGQGLRAVGQVVRSGRRLSVCEVDVFVENAGKEVLCAKLVQTLICLHDSTDQPPKGETAMAKVAS